MGGFSPIEFQKMWCAASRKPWFAPGRNGPATADITRMNWSASPKESLRLLGPDLTSLRQRISGHVPRQGVRHACVINRCREAWVVETRNRKRNVLWPPSMPVRQRRSAPATKCSQDIGR
jgi:hypothetical protein